MNDTRQLQICALNIGRTIHLSPAETFEPIDHLEINENQKMASSCGLGLSRSGQEVSAKLLQP
jgi:hypothetical protein